MTDSEVFRPKPSGGIKFGMQAADHDGWILMNGRNLNTLTAAQKQYATDMYGWTTVVPDMRNAEVVDTNAAIGTFAGADSVNLTQANLPNYTMNGTLAQVTNTHNHDLNNAGPAILHPVGGADNFKSAGNGNQRGARNITVNTGGANNHTFNIAIGNGVAVNTENPYMGANVFVFLGTD